MVSESSDDRRMRGCEKVLFVSKYLLYYKKENKKIY